MIDPSRIRIGCGRCPLTFAIDEWKVRCSHRKNVHRIMTDPILQSDKIIRVLAAVQEGIIKEPFMPRDVRNVVDPRGKAASFSSWLHGNSTHRRRYFKQVDDGWAVDYDHDVKDLPIIIEPEETDGID